MTDEGHQHTADPNLDPALGIGGLLGGIANNTLIQMVLYQLVGALVGPVLQPYAQTVGNTVWPTNPVVPLSPSEAALAVIRNIVTEDQGAAEAVQSGTNRARFHQLVQLTGDAPAPEELAIALRRKIITQARYEEGIRQGRLRDEWSDTIKALAVNEPSPQAILQAYLEGQVSEADARARYAQLGGAPEYFDILFNAQGSAPTPLEAAAMARRGIIPWTGHGAGVVSFEQAFLEGPWRNKWLKPYQDASAELPPPRTVTAMFREGALTHAQAADLLAKQGLTPALVEAYLFAGSSGKTQSAKDLTQAVLIQLYRDRLMPAPQVTKLLIGLGYDASEADYLIALADFQLQAKWVTSAVSRLHSLYVGHHLTKAHAVNALKSLGIDTAAQGDILADWDLELAANVKQLTPSEIAGAYKYDVMTAEQALARLGEAGYVEADAWLYLAVHNHGSAGLPPPPPGVTLQGIQGGGTGKHPETPP